MYCDKKDHHSAFCRHRNGAYSNDPEVKIAVKIRNYAYKDLPHKQETMVQRLEFLNYNSRMIRQIGLADKNYIEEIAYVSIDDSSPRPRRPDLLCPV